MAGTRRLTTTNEADAVDGYDASPTCGNDHPWRPLNREPGNPCKFARDERVRRRAQRRLWLCRPLRQTLGRMRGRVTGRTIWGLNRRGGDLMIAFGIVLLILAAVFPKLAVLWGIGIIVLVIGVILALAGTLGHAIGGRRHYY